MPELPEVENVVRALGPFLAGRRIVAVQVLSRSAVSRSPEPLDALKGRRIERLWRRGKFILADLSGGYGLALHLRMTGWLGVRRRLQLVSAGESPLRVVLALDGATGPRQELLLFRDSRKFGRFWCAPRARLVALPELARLGPEALEITRAEFVQSLRGRRRQLKPLLLDQAFLAGLGNIYADESLYAARLHPLQQAARVSPAAAARLHRAIRRILRRAIAAGGTSIGDYFHPDGSPGWFQLQLKAYGREGQECPRCGARIRRISVGQRGTWYCPRCQRAGRHAITVV